MALRWRFIGMTDINAKRLHWLHDCSSGQTDAEGYEWGIYRVKWENGRAVDVLATLADFSDLDAEMERELHTSNPSVDARQSSQPTKEAR